MCKITFEFNGSMDQLTQSMIGVDRGNEYDFLENDVTQRKIALSGLSDDVYRALYNTAILKTPDKFIDNANVSVVWYLTELNKGKFELETMDFYDVWFNDDVPGGSHEFTVDETDSRQLVLYAKHIKMKLLDSVIGARNITIK